MEEDERCAFCPVLFVQGFFYFQRRFTKKNSFENTKKKENARS